MRALNYNPIKNNKVRLNNGVGTIITERSFISYNLFDFTDFHYNSICTTISCFICYDCSFYFCSATKASSFLFSMLFYLLHA